MIINISYILNSLTGKIENYVKFGLFKDGQFKGWSNAIKFSLSYENMELMANSIMLYFKIKVCNIIHIYIY